MSDIAAVSRAARAPLPPFDDAAPVGASEMVAIASKHRWKIVGALLLPPVVALAVIILLPKTYRAQSDIMVKTGREYMAQGDGESAGFTAPTSTKQEGINSEIAMLTSRGVVEATIATIGLDTLYPEIAADPPSSGSVLDAAVLHFGRDLSVEPVKLSNVVSTSFDAPSPAQARHVLDTLVRIYIEKHTQVFAGRRADGYRDSIDKALADVRSLEQRRSTLKLNGRLYDPEAQRRAVIQQRVDAETRLEDARIKTMRLAARIASLNQARDKAPAMTVLASTERSDAQSHAAQALIDLTQQEAALQDRVGDANPDLQRLRAQIATVQRVAGSAGKERNATTAPSALRQQLQQETVMADADLAAAGSEVERLTAFVAARDAELARMERADVELRDLGLQIDMVTQNLKAMQGRYEQARADEQTDIARQVSVVQIAAASGSQRPVAPKKLIFAAVGLMLGVLLAGIVTLVAIITSKTALTGAAAERRVGLPVLAEVPVYGEEAELAYGAR